MTHNHSSQTDSGQAKPKSNSPILVEKQPLAEQGSSPARSSNSTNEQTRTKLSQPLTYKHNREKLNGNKPEQRVEPSKPSKPSKPSHSQQPKLNLKAKAIAVTFVIAMIPVLAVGTAFHYFASHSFEQMTQEADTKGHRRLVPILLMGTGVTAMFAGALAALWANRAIGSAASATAAARKISEEQSKREQLLIESISEIHQSLQEKDILKAAVKQARRVVGADRVLIYSLEEPSWGKVIAESVVPGWPKALGTTIEDPCFKSRYFEQYQNGRIQAMEDIYAANLTSCYLNELESLSVKAGLVVPVLNQGKLLGLLIAHQCSTPRAWEKSEIDVFAQIATQTGLALNNAQLLTNYAHLQKQAETETEWTKLLTNAVSNIRTSLKQEDILSAAVEE
ncbi:MAG: GAF domain-containing protein, partial [Prochloraceae cyanobacterium]